MCKYTLQPEAKEKITWDWVMIVLTLYSLVIIPWNAAFSPATGSTMFPLDMTVTVFFFMDIVVNFRTAYPDHQGNNVFDSRMIYMRYLRFGFPIDLLAAFPFEIFAPAFTNVDPDFAVALLKLPGLLRGVRLVDNQRLDDLSSPLWRIMKLLLSFVMLAHLNASLFFLVGTYQPRSITGTVASTLLCRA